MNALPPHDAARRRASRPGLRPSPGRRAPAWRWSLALPYLIVASAERRDLAAQEYRTDLFAEWPRPLGQAWYAGHHLPGYSVLFPPLGSLLGPRLVAALAAVAAAWLFERSRPAAGGWRRRGRGPSGSRPASVTTLFTGRLTFALGSRSALGALLAAQRADGAGSPRARGADALRPRRRGLPGAGRPAWWLGSRRRGGWARLRAARGAARRAPLVLAAGALAAAALVASPSPRAASSRSPARRSSGRRSPRGGRRRAGPPARAGALRYGCAALRARAARRASCSTRRWAATPRGWAPLCSAGRWRRPARCGERRASARSALLALPLLYWQWLPPVRDVGRGAATRRRSRLLRAAARQLAGRARADGPAASRSRSRATTGRRVHVARRVSARARLGAPARRQAQPALLRRGPPRPLAYRRWLDRASGRYVAVPGVRSTTAGREEARLVARGASGPARGLAGTATGGCTRHGDGRSARGRRASRARRRRDHARAAAAGTVDLRVRFTPYWRWSRARLRRAGAGGLDARCVSTPRRVRMVSSVALHPGRSRAPLP